jgi:ribosomal protein L31
MKKKEKKKEIHLPVHNIAFHCTYCQSEYQTVSTLKKNTPIVGCQNCNAFYKGTDVSEIRSGAVERLQRKIELRLKKNASKQI